MKFDKIIPNVDLEDYKTEFKGILKEGPNITNNGENLENSWLKEFVAFANTMGGTLYVGVDNKTHEILSIDRNTLDKMVLMIHRLVKERIEPQIYYKIGGGKLSSKEDYNPTPYVETAYQNFI